MLGQLVLDPDGIERAESMQGLGLLPINTTMLPSKVTFAGTGELVTGSLFAQPVGTIALRGYEIHVGETSYLGQAQPFTQLVRQPVDGPESVTDGCISRDSRVFGTYLHGLFDEDGFRHTFIASARAFCQLAPAEELNNWGSKRRESLDRLAKIVSESLDLPKIFGWVGLRYQSSPMKEATEDVR